MLPGHILGAYCCVVFGLSAYTEKECLSMYLCDAGTMGNVKCLLILYQYVYDLLRRGL